MTKLVGGLYRYNDGQFSVVSFHPDVLQGAYRTLLQWIQKRQLRRG